MESIRVLERDEKAAVAEVAPSGRQVINAEPAVHAESAIDGSDAAESDGSGIRE
jgi:hypothetical protein